MRIKTEFDCIVKTLNCSSREYLMVMKCLILIFQKNGINNIKVFKIRMYRYAMV